jgi:hypothetical protein
MKRTVFVLLCAWVMQGCTAVYHVRVNNYVDTAAGTAMTPGASFFILENTRSENPLLEKQLRSKITVLLTERGYKPAPYPEANFYVDASYNMSEGQIVQDYRPEVLPDYGFITYGHHGRYHSSVGATVYVPYWYTLYITSLTIKIYDGPAFRTANQQKTLWIGENSVITETSDIRKILNYLLVAAIAHFGQDTHQTVFMNIKENDPVVKTIQ